VNGDILSEKTEVKHVASANIKKKLMGAVDGKVGGNISNYGRAVNVKHA